MSTGYMMGAGAPKMVSNALRRLSRFAQSPEEAVRIELTNEFTWNKGLNSALVFKDTGIELVIPVFEKSETDSFDYNGEWRMNETRLRKAVKDLNAYWKDIQDAYRQMSGSGLTSDRSQA